jgi:hypothetical protein
LLLLLLSSVGLLLVSTSSVATSSATVSTLLLTVAAATASSVSTLLLLLVSTTATIAAATAAASVSTSLLLGSRHDRLRRLLQNDTLDHLLHLVAPLRRTNHSGDSNLGTWCREGWNLNFSSTLVLHLPNDTTGTPNAHSHVLVRNLKRKEESLLVLKREYSNCNNADINLPPLES